MYDVMSKDGEIFDPDHSAKISFIFLSDLGQNCDLHKSLLHQLLTPLGNLQGHQFLCFVIENFDHLAEWPLIDRFYDFVAISYMVADLILVKLTI